MAGGDISEVVPGDSDISGLTTTVLLVLGTGQAIHGYTVPRMEFDGQGAEIHRSIAGRAMARLCIASTARRKSSPHSGVGVAALYFAGKIDNPLLPKSSGTLISKEYQRYSVEDLCSAGLSDVWIFFRGHGDVFVGL